jgi:PAS domain S-box-containing protein
MGTFCAAVSGRLDLVFFIYGLSFAALGMLLFIQPNKESSFRLTGALWLLGWFGAVHGANEFLDMWALIRPVTSTYFELAKFILLLASFMLLLEFARRAARALEEEDPHWHTPASGLLCPALTPSLGAVVLVLAAFSDDFGKSAPALARLLLGLPGATLAGAAFLGYARSRRSALVRLKAENYFLAAGASFIAYALLVGLLPNKTGWFPPSVLNSELFMAVTGLPVQLFRAVCAATIFLSAVGILRVFREGALQAAQQELLDIIEFFPDATFITDKDRKVIAWNRALEKMTGVPRSKILGKGDFAYSVPFYGERRPIIIDLIGEPHPEAERLYKFVKKRADGAVYAEVFVPSLYGGKGAHVWVTASPLMDKDGTVYGAIESIRDITDRKLAEEALHRSEAQYRALIETTNTGFLIIDMEGRVLDANQEYARLSGHKNPDEIRGRLVTDWTAPHEKTRNSAAVQKCAQDGFIRNFEVDYVDKAGNITPIELNATIVDIEGEKRILTLCRDITERKNIQKALLESEEMYRSLVDHAPMGIILHRDGIIKYVNRGMAELGRIPDASMLLSKSILDFIHPDYRDMVKKRTELIARTNEPLPPVEEKVVGPDGTVFDMEIHSIPISYQGQDCIMSLVQDITERKRAQEGLKESEERYRTLVNNAQVGIVVHRLGVMKFANKKMAELVRVPDPKDVIGRNVLEFMHPDYVELVKERFSKAAAADTPMPAAEEKLVAADGTALDVEINTVPITYEGERCSMAIVQDITARKKAELELMQVNAGLEKRVEERTRQLAEANKELEAFSYSAAHDLKAPLRRVNIFAEMLEKEAGAELKSGAREYMGNIRKSVGQMTALVQGLLTLSTTGRKPLELEAVRLSAVAEEAAAEVRAENAGRAIEWTMAGLPEVNCDRAMMKQVFMNLFGNAAKYTRGREPARIEVFYSLKDGEHVIGVRDNGVGFNMEYADKLFGVFQRLHKAEEFEGTGIGLSTVRRIIVRHGGRVWAESTPGGGAVFYFSLPAIP